MKGGIRGGGCDLEPLYGRKIDESPADSRHGNPVDRRAPFGFQQTRMDMPPGTLALPAPTRTCHMDLREISTADWQPVDQGRADVAQHVVAAARKGSGRREVALLRVGRRLVSRYVHPFAQPYEIAALHAVSYVRRGRTGAQELRTSSHHNQTM
jgi:hypothetical protein